MRSGDQAVATSADMIGAASLILRRVARLMSNGAATVSQCCQRAANAATTVEIA
jgi:hypothetical protein